MSLLTTERALALAPTELLIGGRWSGSSTGETITVQDPATEDTLAVVQAASADDAAAALDAADAARRSWADTPPRERSEVLRRAFEAIMAKQDEFAALITLEMGKPLADARSEVAYAAEFLRWYAEEAVRINGRVSVAPEGHLEMIVVKRPVGPALLITPWNFPLAMATRKVAPALAAGCTIVLKPASLTPLSALAFGRVMEEAGAPAGVVNVIPSLHSGTVSARLMGDPRLRKVSFTGSTEVGRTILREASTRVLKSSMELGGCAPFIVFPDADLDVAVQAALTAKLRSNGEACNAANSFFVHADRLSEFAERLAAAFAALTVGPGLEAGVDMGPLVSADQRATVAGLVDQAVQAGAPIVTGGGAREGRGFFYEPTVLADVPADAAILRTEIFGPVAPISGFVDTDDVIRRANAADAGLAGYVFTRDMDLVARLGREIEVGMLAVNSGPISNAAAPFGGVRSSGLGREGGPEGLEDYLETQYIGLPRHV